MINIDKFKELSVLVIGDLMLDEYLWGTVDRISPEAPVPVVAVEKMSHTLGGAGNVINNLSAMGAKVFAMGAVGAGPAGRDVLKKLEALSVDVTGVISEPDRPTTRKTRIIAASQQMLRIDREVRYQISAHTLDKLTQIIAEYMSKMDLVIISDYDKGLVTRELVASIVDIAKKSGVMTLADPKSMDFSKYMGVTVLTPNKKEAAIAAGIQIETPEEMDDAAAKIIAQAGLEKLLITCGKAGMVLYEIGKPAVTIESKARQVFDVSGAGDTVISLLGLGLASGATFKAAAGLANLAAGIVVAKVGTATASIDELKQCVMTNV
ncbi:D-glycero-beta-D-manno-heptose-7-phosphate kinase [uncultured Desulfobacter sp.]|uniref:D-glycero-beta-D-manno-heptose-7-phosphate kinase n=1 Tax=uncultured Desulfobacter sp. TaxID=240139 RepID=UPI0029F52ECE|nr:D-glycero-beta-D-manno-heptose-7-phosphate kinase [uncultured Desulfobacter sp.]